MPNGIPPGLGDGAVPPAPMPPGGPAVPPVPPIPPMAAMPPPRKKSKHLKHGKKHGGGPGMIGAGRQPKPRGGGFY